LVDTHVTARFVAPDGRTVDTSNCVVPTVTLVTAGLKVTPVAGTAVTVMTLAAVNAPSAVVTVMVAAPGALPVTKPEASTVAIAPLLEDQATAALVALAGETVANSCCVVPA